VVNLRSVNPINKVTIYNLFGQEVLTFSSNYEKQISIPIESLTAGMYLLEIKQDNLTQTKKLIIKK
jgi:hypothetical protein